MKTHVDSDSWGRRERLLALAIIVGAIVVIALILTAGAHAQDVVPACPTPTPPPTAIKLSGFSAAPAGFSLAPLPCTCSANGRTWPCAVRFERVGVRWLPVRACVAPPTSRIAGLAAPAAKICTAWRVTSSCCKTVLGIKICSCFKFACVKASAKTAGLAAPAEGNKGSCGYRNSNMRYGLTCNVSDAGPGFVSGKCAYGYWFSRVSTARTFRIGEIVTVNGCEGLKKQIYAPIRISK